MLKNKGPMENDVKAKQKTTPGCTKPLSQRQLTVGPGPCHPQIEQEKGPHATHSFVWYLGGKTPTSLTCHKAGTIEDSLKRSAEFTRLGEKNTNKELVIVRDGRAISTHTPCSMIQKDRLTVKFIKAQPNQLNEYRAPAIAQRNELVFFHMLTSGGENVVRIMRNPALKKLCEEITVYAYRGEKVKHALKRDGRLLSSIFTKNCALFDRRTGIKTEMLDLADDLDGKTVKIQMISRSPPPESPPESLDDPILTQSESQRSECDENQDLPKQSTTTESVNENMTKEETGQNGNIAPEKIPDSQELKRFLSSQVKMHANRMGAPVSKLSKIQNLFRVEFGKNAQTCSEVKIMKKLMDLSDSVCQVRINGKPEGSGFLLFDQFVLTNGHVVRNIYDESSRQLNEQVTVHFSYESVNQVESGAEVTEVTGYEFNSDPSGQKYDWALLRLRADQNLPAGLFNHFGFLQPKSGGICIIGHPSGGVKKIDPCLIIPTDNYNKAVEKHYHETLVGNQGPINLVTLPFFQNLAHSLQSQTQILAYDSCFYYSSSGSPVFDEHCNVVAMHSGGYVYDNTNGKICSVMEFGYPLSLTFEHVIVQLVETRRFDVLKRYLACSNAQQKYVMTNVKKLVESRNLTVFKNAVNRLLHTEDEKLREFFEFFSQKEEPVPMNIDSLDNC